MRQEKPLLSQMAFLQCTLPSLSVPLWSAGNRCFVYDQSLGAEAEPRLDSGCSSAKVGQAILESSGFGRSQGLLSWGLLGGYDVEMKKAKNAVSAHSTRYVGAVSPVTYSV